MWAPFPAKPWPPTVGATAKLNGQLEEGNPRRRGGLPGTGAAAFQGSGHGDSGSGSGSSGGGGWPGGSSHRASTATTTGNGQKKLTPPLQLHERGFLKGHQYRQSHLHLPPRSQSLLVVPSSSSARSSSRSEAQYQRRPHQLQQYLNSQREQGSQSPRQQRQTQSQTQRQTQNQNQHQNQSPGRQQQPQTQHLRLHVRGGQKAQGIQQPERPARGGGGGGSVRPNFPYANSNRDPAALNATSTLHHQNHWPDELRNPNGGLGIQHNVSSPITPPKDDIKGGAERIQSPQDTIEDLLPPPSLVRSYLDSRGQLDTSSSSSWRPASSIYSLKRDSYDSPVTSNFAIVAAQNHFTSAAAADISPPSSPDLDARPDGNPTQHRSVSPIEDSPDMSQLAFENQHFSLSGTPSLKSNIPTMRRERRKNQEADAPHNQRETKSQHETKWDDMTGEPTSLDTGRAGQVRPQEYAQGLVDHSQPFGNSPAAMKAMRNAQTFGDRLRRLRPIGGSPKHQKPERGSSATATPTAPESVDERPPWRGPSGLRGASGRTAIVSPVRDTAPKEPLSIPRKSSKRTAVGPRLPFTGVTSPLSPVSPSESETSSRTKAPTIRTVLKAPLQLMSSPSPSASPSPEAAATRTPPPAQSSYPSPPNSGSASVQSPVHATPDATKDAPIRSRQLTSLPGLPGLPAAPNAHLGQDRLLRRKPSPANLQALHAPKPSYSSSVYSEATLHASSAHERSPPRLPRSPGEALKAIEPGDQPPSRFSVATYATSAANTPRPSTDTVPPPVPALPSLPHSDGVMSRKRPPVLGHMNDAVNPDQPFVISMSSPYMSSPFINSATPFPARSELPSQKHTMPRASTPSTYSTSSRPESVWSTTKALPPPPTETSMVNDRVGYLNARLESLSNRRININQAIKQMTELMPTDSILASDDVLRKREAEKRKVEALKIELAEVQREEYEIGLKLHRAYKRMDRNAEYEPTTLWVRRVTG